MRTGGAYVLMSSGKHPLFLLFIQHNLYVWILELSFTWTLVDKAFLAFILKEHLNGQRDFGGIFFSLLTMALSLNALMPFPLSLAATILWCF